MMLIIDKIFAVCENKSLAYLKKIDVKICPASLYEKARKLNIPLATKLEDHDSPQWHPQVIYVPEKSKAKK